MKLHLHNPLSGVMDEEASDVAEIRGIGASPPLSLEIDEESKNIKKRRETERKGKVSERFSGFSLQGKED